MPTCTSGLSALAQQPPSSYLRRAVCLHPGGPDFTGSSCVWCPRAIANVLLFQRLATASRGLSISICRQEEEPVSSKPHAPLPAKLTGRHVCRKDSALFWDSLRGQKVKTPRLEGSYPGDGFDPWLRRYQIPGRCTAWAKVKK